MIKIRAVFEKHGRAKYISHLDLNRCMQRAFKRSGLPIWYTEGFNPHIYINFALPLSLGYESSVEIMDFNITEEVPFEEIVEKLNNAMPEGLSVSKAYIPETKHTQIRFADFKIAFSDDITEKFKGFMEQKSINTIKKTKSGEKEIDLKPDINVISFNKSELILRLPAGNEKNINPSLVIDLFLPYCENKIEVLSTERIAVINENGRNFV